MDDMKMYCIFSKEALSKLNGIRGKLATQAGHGYLHAYWDALERFPDYALSYKNSGFSKKITCVLDTDEQVTDLYERIKSYCGVSLVVDAGFTVFKEPTQTCLGVGPIDSVLAEKLNLNSLKTLT